MICYQIVKSLEQFESVKISLLALIEETFLKYIASQTMVNAEMTSIVFGKLSIFIRKFNEIHEEIAVKF